MMGRERAEQFSVKSALPRTWQVELSEGILIAADNDHRQPRSDWAAKSKAGIEVRQLSAVKKPASIRREHQRCQTNPDKQGTKQPHAMHAFT